MHVDDTCALRPERAEGSGSLVDAHTVEVSLPGGASRRVTAKHILIAAGGRAVKAPIEGAVRPPGNAHGEQHASYTVLYYTTAPNFNFDVFQVFKGRSTRELRMDF